MNNKAISRQYHTYFSWKDTNANSFFGLFGDIFSNFIKQEVIIANIPSSSIKAFPEIGAKDRLVHQDFGTFF